MSLPITGAPKRPSRPPSHQPIAMDRLMRLSSDLEDAVEESDGSVITPELIGDVGAEHGTKSSHLMAAACMTELAFESVEEVTFVACAGGCQGWGALDRVEQLLTLYDRRQQEGLKLFNIHARNCLDKCEHAPVVTVHTPDGVAVIAAATEQSIAEAVEQTCR